MKFKLGDRVVCKEAVGPNSMSNQKGRIRQTDGVYVGVEFDNHMGGHALGGKGKTGHCWQLSGRRVTKILDNVWKGKRR